jgi:hypothetical protein
MVDIDDATVDSAAAAAATAVPVLTGLIPVGPATELGRHGAPDEGGPPGPHDRYRRRAAALGQVAAAPAPVTAKPGARPYYASGAGVPAETAVLAALRGVGPLRTERLLGALEHTIARLPVAAVPGLAGYVPPPPSGGWFATACFGNDSEATVAATTLEQLRAGITDLTIDLVRRLATHPSLVALLAVPPEVTEEPAIAARHGANHLALAVAAACTVVDHAPMPALIDRSAATVGIGVGAAAILLREAPMPPQYAAALLARIRAEYRPHWTGGTVPVDKHRYALTETGLPDAVDFTANGLVAVVDRGVAIRTGIADGDLLVRVSVLADPPAEVQDDWDEVVEVSWHAAEGRASITGPAGTGDPNLRRVTPPWPGDYRIRVHARGRDDTDDPGAETHHLVIWAAPPAPPVVHRRTDRLGHLLSGQPEPVRPDRPELAYRWLRHSPLAEAATVTVATGITVEDLLRAFGADPDEPEAISDIIDDLTDTGSIDPWVAVLDTDDAILAVEYNGWQGSLEPVLHAASTGGRAASMYWNVNAVTRLSFAEHGQILASFEPWGTIDTGPAVAAALSGVDFTATGDRPGKGLVAVERFTGRGLTADDLDRIQAAGIAFRIVPHLPTLYPYHPTLGTRIPDLDTAAVEQLPDDRLRDLAWWAATEAVRYADLADDPDIAASIAARALTGPATRRARESQLDAGEHRWLWQTLHNATNPDPRAALVNTLDAARYAAGPHAAQLLDEVRHKVEYCE